MTVIPRRTCILAPNSAWNLFVKGFMSLEGSTGPGGGRRGWADRETDGKQRASARAPQSEIAIRDLQRNQWQGGAAVRGVRAVVGRSEIPATKVELLWNCRRRHCD